VARVILEIDQEHTASDLLSVIR